MNTSLDRTGETEPTEHPPAPADTDTEVLPARGTQTVFPRPPGARTASLAVLLAPPSMLPDAPGAVAPDPRPNRRRKALRLAGTALVALALLALAGGVVYFAHASQVNRHSAQRWQASSVALGHYLTARTAELNERSAALAKSAAELAGLGRQVSGLEGRLRSLADEKAQVEDQRGLLASQAAELTTIDSEQTACSQGLSQLLQAFANADYIYVDDNASAVGASCQQAQTDFQTFQAQQEGQ